MNWLTVSSLWAIQGLGLQWGKDYWCCLWKAPNTHIWFFFGTWLVKLPHFYLTLVMAFVAWSGWPWLFFMTYWNNTSSSYLPVCESTHTANPFPVIKTGFSCVQILTENPVIVRGNPSFIAWETCDFPAWYLFYPKWDYSAHFLTKCCGGSLDLIQELVIQPILLDNTIWQNWSIVCAVLHQLYITLYLGFLIDPLITIWTINKKAQNSTHWTSEYLFVSTKTDRASTVCTEQETL